MNDAAKRIIGDAYLRNGERPVAYIDESYRGASEPGRRFYILTAVVVEGEARDDLRFDIEGVAEGAYWHTVDELVTPAGLQRTKRMLTLLAAGDEISVVALASSIDANDTGLEMARRRCMGQLLPALAAGSSQRKPASLALLERRRDRRQQNRDERTRRELVREGRLPQHFRMLQVSPVDEHLLWLPDVVSAAVRRAVARQQRDLLNIIESQTELLQERSNPLLP